MSVAYVPQAKFLNQPPFNPSDNLSEDADGLNPGLKNCLIEKYLTQLGKNDRLGEPYVKDYLTHFRQLVKNCFGLSIG